LLLDQGLDLAEPVFQQLPGIRGKSLARQLLPVLQSLDPAPAFVAGSPTWAGDIVHNQQWLAHDPPTFGWTQVLAPAAEVDSPVVAASGTAVLAWPAKSDFWFTHPFGSDQVCMLELDHRFDVLLSANNDHDPTGATDDYAKGSALAPGAPHGPLHAGVLGLEMDGDLIPSWYFPQAGDRVAVFGRWIVDAGHTDFHTEIHPPLVLARTNPSALHGVTESTIIGRPYLVGQAWPEGSMRAHLIRELEKAAAVVASQRVEAHPKVFTTPFQDTFSISYLVRPPTLQPESGLLSELTVWHSLTGRTGVDVRLSQVDSCTIQVVVAFNATEYQAAPLPPRSDRTIGSGELLDEAGGLVATIGTFLGLLGTTYVEPVIGEHLAWVIGRGVLTDAYDVPLEWVPTLDGTLERAPARTLQGEPVQIRRDDAQPFPIFGRIDVGWPMAQ
jgi:hypothetical protein